MDRRIDLAVALAFAAFGLFVIVQAAGIPAGVMRDPIGPRAAFYVGGGVMLGGGLILAARRLASWRGISDHMVPNEGTPDEPGHPASTRRAFLIVAACLIYALLFQPLGYLLATPPFVFLALFVMGERHWPVTAAIALIFTGTAYVVFAQVLGVRVPVGPFTELFRELGWIVL